MFCSKVIQALEVTVRATVHSVTFGVAQDDTKRRSQSKRASHFCSDTVIAKALFKPGGLNAAAHIQHKNSCGPNSALI